MTLAYAPAWVGICRYDDLGPDRGVTALVDGEQVAVFRTRTGSVYALGNRDPFSGAYVLSRGIVGDRDGVAVVASPMYKQAFELATGCCLDEPSVAVPVWPVRVCDGIVEVAA